MRAGQSLGKWSWGTGGAWGGGPGQARGKASWRRCCCSASVGYGPRGGQLRNLEGCAEDRPPKDERGVGAALPPPGKACPSVSRCPVGPAGISHWVRAALGQGRAGPSDGSAGRSPRHTLARCPHPRLPWGSLFSLSRPGQMTQVSPVKASLPLDCSPLTGGNDRRSSESTWRGTLPVA